MLEKESGNIQRWLEYCGKKGVIGKKKEKITAAGDDIHRTNSIRIQ